ncbi:hypothetical protein ACLOJK_012879 [Asimina triloba]
MRYFLQAPTQTHLLKQRWRIQEIASSPSGSSSPTASAPNHRRELNTIDKMKSPAFRFLNSDNKQVAQILQLRNSIGFKYLRLKRTVSSLGMSAMREPSKFSTLNDLKLDDIAHREAEKKLLLSNTKKERRCDIMLQWTSSSKTPSSLLLPPP